MTQQLDHPAHPAHPATTVGAPVRPPAQPPWVAPPQRRAPPPKPERSTGALIAILVGAGTAGLLVVVLVVGLLIGLLAGPAGSSSPTPTQDPGYRRATEQAFDAAGVRIDHARGVFSQQLRAAAAARDLDAVHAAARNFRVELELYRSTVAGLRMPADQQAAFSGVLAPALDASIADAGAMEHASTASDLAAAGRSFDQHWTLLTATHNRVNRALADG